MTGEDRVRVEVAGLVYKVSPFTAHMIERIAEADDPYPLEAWRRDERQQG